MHCNYLEQHCLKKFFLPILLTFIEKINKKRNLKGNLSSNWMSVKISFNERVGEYCFGHRIRKKGYSILTMRSLRLRQNF